MSRPKADYHCIFVHQVKKLCLLGMIDTEIAEFFDVSVRTLNRWKHKYPEFWQSMKQGKISADANVAESLYKSALGLHYITEERIIQNEKGHKIVTLKKQVPPSFPAQKYWLNNRQPDKWSERQKPLALQATKEISIDHLQNLANVMEKAHERQRLLRIERGNATEGDFREVEIMSEKSMQDTYKIT